MIACKHLFSIIKGYDNDIKRTGDLEEDVYREVFCHYTLYDHINSVRQAKFIILR